MQGRLEGWILILVDTVADAPGFYIAFAWDFWLVALCLFFVRWSELPSDGRAKLRSPRLDAKNKEDDGGGGGVRTKDRRFFFFGTLSLPAISSQVDLYRGIGMRSCLRQFMGASFDFYFP